jgi:hypothetical protein
MVVLYLCLYATRYQHIDQIVSGLEQRRRLHEKIQLLRVLGHRINSPNYASHPVTNRISVLNAIAQCLCVNAEDDIAVAFREPYNFILAKSQAVTDDDQKRASTLFDTIRKATKDTAWTDIAGVAVSNQLILDRIRYLLSLPQEGLRGHLETHKTNTARNEGDMRNSKESIDKFLQSVQAIRLVAQAICKPQATVTQRCDLLKALIPIALSHYNWDSLDRAKPESVLREFHRHLEWVLQLGMGLKYAAKEIREVCGATIRYHWVDSTVDLGELTLASAADVFRYCGEMTHNDQGEPPEDLKLNSKWRNPIKSIVHPEIRLILFCEQTQFSHDWRYIGLSRASCACCSLWTMTKWAAKWRLCWTDGVFDHTWAEPSGETGDIKAEVDSEVIRAFSDSDYLAID